MRQRRHKPTNFGPETIDRGRGCDVQRVVILVSPSQVGRLLGHFNRSKMVTLCIPHPNSFRAGHKQIAALVNFNSVGHAVLRTGLLFSKHSSIRKIPVWRNVVHANISLFAVIYVEALAIWRECEAVGLTQVFS